MPSPPPAASGNSPFEGIDEDTGTRRRRRQQRSYAGLWTLGLLSLLGIGFAGLWLGGVVQFKLPQGVGQQAKDEGEKKSAQDESKQVEEARQRLLRELDRVIAKQDHEMAEQDRQAKAEAAKHQQEQAVRQAEIDRSLAELDQQAKKDIAEIDQRLTSYRRVAAIWEQKAAALRQNPRFGDPFNPGANAAMRSLNQESAALQRDLQSISRLIEQKQQAFNQKRDAILRQFPDATLPTWTNYYGESR